MTLDLQDFETSVIDALSTHFGDELAVEAFPDDVTTYRVTHPNGAVLLRWDGASNLRSIGEGAYIIAHRFEFTLFVRNLHTDNGIYNVWQEIKDFFNLNLIDGFKLEFRDASSENYYEAEMLWRYVMNYETLSYEYN